jgi:hypothetical protein
MEKPIMVLENALQGLGRLNSLVKKLMDQVGTDDANEAIRCVNSGEWILTRRESRWIEKDGVISFSVISEGTTGEDWIIRLESRGLHVDKYANQVLRSPDFKPTIGVTIEVALLKGMIFKDNDRITKKIRAEADKRKFSKPNAELACLIREKFTNKEIEAMGLRYVVAMHEPINDFDGSPRLLRVDRLGGEDWLGAYYGEPDSGSSRGFGFAFVASQVTSLANDVTSQC